MCGLCYSKTKEKNSNGDVQQQHPDTRSNLAKPSLDTDDDQALEGDSMKVKTSKQEDNYQNEIILNSKSEEEEKTDKKKNNKSLAIQWPSERYDFPSRNPKVIDKTGLPNMTDDNKKQEEKTVLGLGNNKNKEVIIDDGETEFSWKNPPVVANHGEDDADDDDDGKNHDEDKTEFPHNAPITNDEDTNFHLAENSSVIKI
ncbi:uncharacterized protein DDB_G0283697-like [Papaver somniferum]|uniref:uncharacterized protein DDB_G0283697-like n=1 Tax=Papaver somniferum TaxID=3469 RepID=UPI000E6FBA67|nr:uncharacterized protein DDB_G0283697-like [Papaver somniferum]